MTSVLHVVDSLAAGGVETTFLHVLRRLAGAATHDVLALSGGALEREFGAAARRLVVTRRTTEIARLLDEGDYDVVHVLFERAAERVVPLVVTRAKAAIVYGKNYDFSGQWRTTEGFEWTPDDALMAACDRVTFTTPQLAAGYDAAERARGCVLGKAADVRPLLEIGPPADEVPDRVLVIANPTPRKRLGDLVAALTRVRREVPGVELRVVGAGDATETRRLAAAAREAGVADRFVLAGHSRDVAAELAGSRVVALSSASEGVPTALIEGMAAGRPVVTTDAGHVRAIVDEGVEGFIVPVGDVAALADRLSRLLGSRPLAAEMGARGRRRAAAHAVEAVAERLSAVLAAHAVPS